MASPNPTKRSADRSASTAHGVCDGCIRHFPVCELWQHQTGAKVCRDCRTSHGSVGTTDRVRPIGPILREVVDEARRANKREPA